MKLWCFEDAHGWGAALAKSAQDRGHDARLFDQTKHVTDGSAFLHMHSHPAVRDHHKRIAAQLATNPDVNLIPSYRLSVLYDDKCEQLRQLATYVPPTRLFLSPQRARDFIDTQPPLPIVSKSGVGAGTRMLRTSDDLRHEVKLAFSDLGIRNRFGMRHHGYVYWQKHLGDVPYIIRIVAIGRQRLAIKRGRQVENGNRWIEPIKELNDEIVSAIAFVDELQAREPGLNFGAYDLIAYKESWKLLKLTVGWHIGHYADAVFWPSQEKASDIWSVFVSEMEAGAL